MYLDLINSSSSDYYEQMPGWIKESVDFNLRSFDFDSFLNLNFLPHLFYNKSLVSHANFNSIDSGTQDWSYVNTVSDYHHQLRLISSFDFRLGVLGHTHRNSCYGLASSGNISEIFQGAKPCLDAPIKLSSFSCSALNAGSIGQPRDRSYSKPSWLLLEFNDSDPCSATYVSFDYDIHSHLADIISSGLSSLCLEKLTSFYPIPS